MRTLWALAIRNMKIYLKNKSSVCFSFLTVMIILTLNTVFLGDINTEKLSAVITADKKVVAYVTNSWLMAGIIVVNAFMVTTVMLNIMVDDEEKHKLAAFVTTPVSRVTLTVSYGLAACLTSFIFSFITLLFSQLYLWMTCEQMISLAASCKVMGVMTANIFSVVSIMMCVATLMRTTSSYGAFNTTMGALIGFIAGIYLPIGNLPESVQMGLKLFPILHGTATVRAIYTEEAVKKAFSGLPAQAIDQYKSYMGIQIYFGDKLISGFMSILILLVSGILFTALATVLLNRKRMSDR